MAFSALVESLNMPARRPNPAAREATRNQL
jgi:hypothetical protein